MKQLPYLIVFLTGATTMALEILGARLLTPYLGATTIVWTSVIAVFLLAIGLGYWAGGALADVVVKPTLPLFILLAAGATVILIVPLASLVMPRIMFFTSYGLSGLMTAGILFLIPVALLSMITIYTIRAQTGTLEIIGRTSGALYGLATMGSIFGVFAAGLWLMPRFSISVIILSLGTLLIITSILALVIYALEKGLKSERGKVGE